MEPFLGKAAFHIGFQLAFVAGALLIFLKKGTATCVSAHLTLAVGLIYMVLEVILVYWGKPREQ